MSQESTSSATVAIMSFIAGAAVGALVVALTTPKSGPEVREDLMALGRRAKGKACELGDQAGAAYQEGLDRAGHAMTDLKRGVHDAANDLRG